MKYTRSLFSTRKDAKKINSFLLSWLLATGRRESTAKRYTKDKSWNGVKKEFDERTDDDGFQYESIADVFREMRDFSKIYLRLIDTKHDFWNQDPYNTANCRNEKNLLRIISTIPNEVQHIPPLMCLINRVEKEGLERETITDFLRNHNYILLRYKSVPKLSGVKAGVVGGDIYTKMQGSENWIKDILETDMSTKEGRARIGRLPLDLENKVKNKGDYPWDKDNEMWKTLNQWKKGDLEKNDTAVKHILFSAEWALDGSKSPTLAMLHTKGIHVEHILPQDPTLLVDEEYGVCWPTYYGLDEDGKTHTLKSTMPIWRKHVHSLGNRCLLEDSANSAIGNHIPTTKFNWPRNPKYPFKNSSFKTARKAHEIYVNGDQMAWEPPQMEKLSMFYMNTIIEKFS